MKIIKQSNYKEVTSNTCGKLVELCNDSDVPISITKAENLKSTIKHKHHDSTEIYWVTQGELELEVADKTVKLEQGDIISIQPGESHKVISSSENNTVIVLSTPPWSPEDEVLD